MIFLFIIIITILCIKIIIVLIIINIIIIIIIFLALFLFQGSQFPLSPKAEDLSISSFTLYLLLFPKEIVVLSDYYHQYYYSRKNVFMSSQPLQTTSELV